MSRIERTSRGSAPLIPSRRAVRALVASLALAAPAAAGEACEVVWDTAFGAQPWGDGAAVTVAVFDDGGGPALYAGGFFRGMGSVPALRIARWDGTSWSSLGAGLDSFPSALAVHDDGTGPALYAAGAFENAGGVPAARVARWDGTSWSALGAGADAWVRTLAVFDDGTGAALYAGGDFGAAGGAPASRVARWDGTAWSDLAGGTDGAVHALAVYDDGAGPALYAGGYFTNAGGVPANRVARWDGTAWTALGAGVGDGVLALHAFDDGTGAVLCAGGAFANAGGGAASRVARWDGTSWSAFGSGFDGNVRSFAVWDSGGGAELYAGGDFFLSNGVVTDGVARWDGALWQPLPGGPGSIDGWSFAVFDDGGSFGESLYMAGGSLLSGKGVARWNGGAWGVPGESGPSSSVQAVESFDGELYAAGSFNAAGNRIVRNIAAWDGDGWSGLAAGGPSGQVDALLAHDDGSGPALYAGGFFFAAGSTPVNHVARYDGTSWSALGAGVDGRVFAFGTYNSDLYLGGTFASAGGNAAPVAALWNGSVFQGLGFEAGGQAYAMELFDDGSGPALYIGGQFQDGGGPRRTLARWDGATLSFVPGAPVESPPQPVPYVSCLAVFDDGSGPALYLGGGFEAGSATNIARWDGTTWSGLPSSPVYPVRALAPFDTGVGPRLCVGGAFGIMTESCCLQLWDGSTWSTLGGGTSAQVNGLFGPFGGQVLVATGFFYDAPAGFSTLARIAPCKAFEAFCFGDGTGDACPCGNFGAPGHGCDLAQATGGIRLVVDDYAPDLAGGGTARFVSTGYPPAASPGTLLIRSTGPQPSGIWLGDGLLCIDTVNFTRVNAALASGGTSLIPAMHGAGAGAFYYQVWARNTPITFCNPATAFNLSNGVELTWP